MQEGCQDGGEGGGECVLGLCVLGLVPLNI